MSEEPPCANKAAAALKTRALRRNMSKLHTLVSQVYVILP
jgi:hypothetical protein